MISAGTQPGMVRELEDALTKGFERMHAARPWVYAVSNGILNAYRRGDAAPEWLSGCTDRVLERIADLRKELDDAERRIAWAREVEAER